MLTQSSLLVSQSRGLPLPTRESFCWKVACINDSVSNPIVLSYVAFGEILAWCVAWFLILGYGFTASVVARAWADYCGDLLIKICQSPSINVPTLWLERFTEWHIFGEAVHYSFSLLSMVIIALNTWILLRGVQDSAVFNNAITIMNMSVLALVITAGLLSGSIQADNLTPFVPHHASSVLQGAGLVFFGKSIPFSWIDFIAAHVDVYLT